MPASRAARRLDQQTPSIKSSFITTQPHHLKSPARSTLMKNQENPVSSPRVRSPYARPRRAVHKPDRFTPSMDDSVQSQSQAGKSSTGAGSDQNQNSIDLKALKGFRSMSISTGVAGAGQKSRKVSGPKTKVKRKGPPAKLHVGTSPSATEYRPSGGVQGYGQKETIPGQQHYTPTTGHQNVSSNHGLLSPSYTLPAYGVQTHQPAFHLAPHQINPFPYGLPQMPGLAHSVPIATTGSFGDGGMQMIGQGQGTMVQHMVLPMNLPRPPVKPVEVEKVLQSDPGANMPIPEMMKVLREKSFNLILANSLYRPLKPSTPPTSLPPSASTATYSSRSTTLPPIREHHDDASSSRSVTPTPTSQATAQLQAQPNALDVTFDATLPFGVPPGMTEKAVNASRIGMESIEEVRNTLKGCEPDHCLAVRSSRMKGSASASEAEMKEEIGRIIPVHHIIYAAQCSNFPGPLRQSHIFPSLPVASAAAEGSCKRTVKSTSSRSNAATEKADVSMESEERVETNASGDTSVEGIDVPSVASQLQTRIDLPMLHIAVPYPSMMITLHEYLYKSDPARLLLTLFDLPSTIAAGSVNPAEILASLSISALLERLKRIHKLWSNVVTLGIADEMLWKAMEKGRIVMLHAVQTQKARVQAEEQRDHAAKEQAAWKGGYQPIISPGPLRQLPGMMQPASAFVKSAGLGANYAGHGNQMQKQQDDVMMSGTESE